MDARDRFGMGVADQDARRALGTEFFDSLSNKAVPGVFQRLTPLGQGDDDGQPRQRKAVLGAGDGAAASNPADPLCAVNRPG